MQKKEIRGGDKEYNILKSFISDQYTRQELKRVFEWFGTSGFNLSLRYALKRNWDSFDIDSQKKEFSEYNEQHMLDSLHHQINLEQIKSRKIRRGRDIRVLYQYFYRAAAVLIIPLTILSVFLGLNNGFSLDKNTVLFSEIYAPENSRMRVILPDGSDVWLNQGSTMKYPQQFAKRNREVLLTGEAFFNVENDPSKPFVVKTSNLNITVLGTSFNVSAYPDDHFITTTVESGKVEVNRLTEDGHKNNTAELKPGMQSCYLKKDEHMSIRKVNPEKYIGWKEGKRILIDDPMAIVEKKLERWYNVEVEILNEKVYDYKYTGTFIHETIEQVLELMSIVTPISYEIEQGNKQDDNTYSKMKIFIK